MSFRTSLLLFGAIISLVVIEAFTMSELFNDPKQNIEPTWQSFNKIPDSIQYKHCPTWCKDDDAMTTTFGLVDSIYLADSLNIIEASNLIKFVA